MDKYLIYYEPFNFKQKMDFKQWSNNYIKVNNDSLFLNNKKYRIYKEDLYFKLKLLYELKYFIKNDFILKEKKNFIIKYYDNDNEFYKQFKLIFYQYDESINSKVCIFEDVINNEFIIIMDCPENSEDFFDDLNLCKNEISLLEEKFICNNYFYENDSDDRETNMTDFLKEDNLKEDNIKINNKLLNNLSNSKLLYSLFFKINTLHRIYKDNYNYTFCGHGKSGSFLSLFSYFYYKIFKNHYCNIITFGMPRYGNQKYKEEYNNLHNLNHWNIINKYDLMSSVPFIDYKHIGNLIFFEKNNTINTANNYSYINLLLRLNVFICNNIKDHSIESYMDSVINNNDLCKNEETNNKYKHKKIYFDFKDNEEFITYYEDLSDTSSIDSEYDYNI